MLIALLTPAFGISATVSPGDDIGAVVSSLRPGDVITFNGGTYDLADTLRISEALGDPGNPVTLTAASSGAAPVLRAIEGDTVFVLQDSANVVIENLVFEGGPNWEEEGGGGVVIQNSSGVTFRNNDVRRVRGDLLRLSGDTSDLTVIDNRLEFSSSGSGIYVGCGDGSCWMSDSRIEHNLIHDTGTPENQRSGLFLDNGCQGNTLVDNVIYNTTSLGIRVKTTQLGDENVVEGNAIWNTGSHGIEVTGEALVRNNVVFETGGVGIRSSDSEGELRNVRITYNTIALTQQEGARLENWADKENMVFSSNVIANITGRGFRYTDDPDETQNRITANVVSGLVEGIDLAIQTDWLRPGGGTGDFVDVLNWDFYPTPSGTLGGAGDPASEAWVPGIDFNGSPRNGEFPTVGALEYLGRENPGWVIRESFKGDAADAPPVVAGPKGGCCSKKEEATDAWLLLPFLSVFGLRRRRQDAWNT